MNAPEIFAQIVDRKLYDVEDATLLADDVFWDGNNMERNGRNTFLYRSTRGAYFTVTLSQWQGEDDKLDVMGEDDAYSLYEGPLTEHYVDYADAFPNVEIVAA